MKCLRGQDRLCGRLSRLKTLGLTTLLRDERQPLPYSPGVFNDLTLEDVDAAMILAS